MWRYIPCRSRVDIEDAGECTSFGIRVLDEAGHEGRCIRMFRRTRLLSLHCASIARAAICLPSTCPMSLRTRCIHRAAGGKSKRQKAGEVVLLLLSPGRSF